MAVRRLLRLLWAAVVATGGRREGAVAPLWIGVTRDGEGWPHLSQQRLCSTSKYGSRSNVGDQRGHRREQWAATPRVYWCIMWVRWQNRCTRT